MRKVVTRYHHCMNFHNFRAHKMKPRLCSTGKNRWKRGKIVKIEKFWLSFNTISRAKAKSIRISKMRVNPKFNINPSFQVNNRIKIYRNRVGNNRLAIKKKMWKSLFIFKVRKMAAQIKNSLVIAKNSKS